MKKEAHNRNSQLLSGIIESYSKLEVMKNQIYEENNYQTEMSMHDARMHFSLRSRMFKCKMNFLNTPKQTCDLYWSCGLQW